MLDEESNETMLGDRDGILNGDVAGDMLTKVSCGTSDAAFTMPEKHPTKVPMLQRLLEKDSSENFDQESTSSSSSEPSPVLQKHFYF